MGDTKTEEDVKWRDDFTVSSNGTVAMIDPDHFDSDKDENMVKNRSTTGKQDLGNNNPEAKSDYETMRFSLDASSSERYCRLPGPSPSLLAALSSLSENSDHMLLPRSLHQIAETYFLEEDYQWAVQFLHLERLYHERLLSNLTAMQEKWESQRKIVSQAKSSSSVKSYCTEAETKCMDSLRHICRTHLRPNCTTEKDMINLKLKIQIPEKRLVVQESSTRNQEWVKGLLEKKNEEDEVLEDEDLFGELQKEAASGEQASREELTELIKVEETFPSNGLVSILKKRTCVKKTDPVDPSPPKSSSKLKVHFSVTDDTQDIDDEGKDSCLIFLFLCLVTVVISTGGTMLYCFLGGAYSNICTDFSHNMDFYFGPVRRGVDTLSQWFTPAASQPKR